MKTLLLFAMALATPQQAQRFDCKIVIHYKSDSPENVTLALEANTCGEMNIAPIAVEAALKKLIGPI